jgi:hypothetical protein
MDTVVIVVVVGENSFFFKTRRAGMAVLVLYNSNNIDMCSS